MNDQRGLIALIIPLILVIMVAVFVLIWKGIIANPLGQFTPAPQTASVSIATPEPTKSTQYQNPFVESTSSSGYSNPFEASQNPFNNLK